MYNPDFKMRGKFPVKMKNMYFSTIILLLFISLIFACSCQGSAVELPVIYGESDWERMGLRGKVKSLDQFEISWQESFGKINLKPESTIDQSTIFLNTGNQSMTTYYGINGLPSWKDEFIYAADGETWLECISYKYAQDDKTVASPQWSYTNTYDYDGNLIRATGYDYDESGQKLATESWVHLYEYLKDEGKIAHSSYNSDGTLQWKNISRYNSAALAVETTQYANSGAILWRDKFKYDGKGNQTEWYRYDSDLSLQWKDVFKFDDNGNEIECSNYDRGNKLIWQDIYLYLNEFELNGFDINNSINHENKFDNNGNWTIKVTLEEKPGFGGTYLTVKEILKRTVTYFP